MSTVNLKLVQGIFGALVVGALGFGASQAMARPVVAGGAERCTPEMHQICDENCVNAGYPGGYCRVPVELGVTVCECF